MWKKFVNNMDLPERWWMEYRPDKWLPGYHNRRRIGWDGPKKVYPLHYARRLDRFERTQFAFNRNGKEYSIPKWGG